MSSCSSGHVPDITPRGAFETIAQALRPGHLLFRNPPSGGALPRLRGRWREAPDGGLTFTEKARDVQNGSDRVGLASEAALQVSLRGKSVLSNGSQTKETPSHRKTRRPTSLDLRLSWTG